MTRIVLVASVLVALVGCESSVPQPTPPKSTAPMIFGEKPEFAYNPGFGSEETQRRAATEGIVGKLSRGTSRWGGSDIVLHCVDPPGKVAVLIKQEHLSQIEMEKNYRFFGRYRGYGHKGLPIHLAIMGAQEVGSQQGVGERDEENDHSGTCDNCSALWMCHVLYDCNVSPAKRAPQAKVLPC